MRDRGLHATAFMRDPERLQGHFDGGERAQYHRRIGVAHMGQSQGLARQVPPMPTPTTTPQCCLQNSSTGSGAKPSCITTQVTESARA